MPNPVTSRISDHLKDINVKCDVEEFSMRDRTEEAGWDADNDDIAELERAYRELFITAEKLEDIVDSVWKTAERHFNNQEAIPSDMLLKRIKQMLIGV